MNCQITFRDRKFEKKYNHELACSMSEVEGSGIFSFGIGKTATYPMGKSIIMNDLILPFKEGISKGFVTYDDN